MTMLALYMFPLLFSLLLLGVPVAFSMLATATVFGWIVFDTALVFQLVEKVEDVASNFVLAAVTLFVFMGCMLERAGIAEQLFEAVHVWTRRMPGGLALGTVVMCIIFAASTGVIGATETVVGLLAIPVMLKHRYDKPLICGTICAGGSLGTIIPPSVVVVVMGPLANVSVGDLLVGMVFPGLIMAGFYVAYIYLLCRIRPDAGPVVPAEEDTMTVAEKLRITAFALVPPLFMIVTVLGSLMLGLAAPTEAAAIGAAGSVLLAAFYGRLSWATLNGAVMKTLQVTAMIMTILLAGSMMTGVFIGAGGVTLAQELVDKAQLGPWGLLALVLGLTFLAGFFLDWISIVLIMIPLFTPLIVAAGFDAVWFCILFLVMIQTSYLTPPMAPAIFYLRGIAPPEITTGHMYRGVLPFIGLQVLTLIIVLVFPQTVLWLPSKLLGFN
ncbi:TRAP transporter large permease subunit [Azospirillum formosense]|uniref:TRAP transporter large permease protein n=1 Tax=Azospirillum formosense TaxID=861533 RepID=A0ABX2KYK6_9PROT|nr:TRAP transporter large permease subunit [Azospirillum formosense]NUB20757.1 TRAP transporter large permease subunit [Azospirillum formosense]